MTLLDFPLSEQGTTGQFRQMNGSPAPLGLGRDKHQAPTGLPLQRSLNDQLSGFQVDVPPGQAKGLTQPKSSGPKQGPQSMPASPGRDLEEMPQLGAT
jgi:hypothetical protein